MRRLVLLACATAACGRPAPAPPNPSPAPPSAPSTDIYLYRLSRLLPFGSRVVNITNRSGYDNQPSWDGSSILYTAQIGSQTDIYRYRGGTHVQVTDTPESEYSAALTPDGKAISVVRVEKDSTQRLWRFPNDGSAPTPVLRDVKPVGYFAWLDTTTLALFVLGNPNTLQIADTRTGSARIVTTNIGRSLQRVPRSRKVSYLHRAGAHWQLETVDPGNLAIDTIAAMPDSAEFVAWRSENELYAAAGSRLLRLRLPAKSWVEVADLSRHGLRHVSRLAFSPDGSTLALVADEP